MSEVRILRQKTTQPLPPNTPQPINHIVEPLSIILFNNNVGDCTFRVTNSVGYPVECIYPGGTTQLNNGEYHECAIPEYLPNQLSLSSLNPNDNHVSVLVENRTAGMPDAEMEYYQR